MANLDLFDYSKSWTLNKYAKFINNNNNNSMSSSLSSQQYHHHHHQRHVQSDSWKTIESSQYITPLTLTITPTNFLMIKNDSEIQEFVNLWTSKGSMKAVYKGDSLIVIHKMRDFIRKFRVQFTRTKFKTGEENCSECVKELVRFFPVLEYSAAAAASNQTSSQSNLSQLDSQQMQRTQQMSLISGSLKSSIELNELTRVLLEKNEHKLPLFYKSCDTDQPPPSQQQSGCSGASVREKEDAMKEFIVSCLLDPKFAAFVKKVETLVTDMITDNHNLNS